MVHPPLLLAAQFLAKFANNNFSVRIHSLVIGKHRPWLKLWYGLRALDQDGSGYVGVDIQFLAALLGNGVSTIRQWLRDGEWAGAFRLYRERGGFLKTYLSSLNKLCLALGLKPPQKKRQRGKRDGLHQSGGQGWGATTSVSIFQLDKLRPIASAIHTQWRQQQSRYAAWHSLPERDRDLYRGIPAVEDFFRERQNSGISGQGQLPFTLHISSMRVWATKGFLSFGVRQETLAEERGYSVRQVANHLKACGVEAKQICQAKTEYRELSSAIAWEAPDFLSSSGKLEAVQIGAELYRVVEQVGRTSNQSSTVVHPGRFFTYMGQTWMYRTNIYKPIFDLLSMRRARSRFRKKCNKSLQNVRTEGLEGVSFNFLDPDYGIHAEVNDPPATR